MTVMLVDVRLDVHPKVERRLNAYRRQDNTPGYQEVTTAD
jgi:hypothetical protein